MWGRNKRLPLSKHPMVSKIEENLHLYARRSGIYKLKIFEHSYIGSSINLESRLKNHLSDLMGNRHANWRLQEAFDKYNVVDFEILTYVEEPSGLVDFEQQYIHELRPDLNIRYATFNDLPKEKKRPVKKETLILNPGTITAVMLVQDKLGHRCVSTTAEFLLRNSCRIIETNGIDSFIGGSDKTWIEDMSSSTEKA